MKQFLKAVVATACLALSSLSHAGSYDWVAQNVGAPVARAVSRVEDSASSMVGGASLSSPLTKVDFGGAGRVACNEMPLPAGSTIDLGYSPDGTAETKVVRAIHEASTGPGKHTLLIAAYEFTSYEIAKAVVQAKESGAKVAVVVDSKENQKKSSKVRYLVEHGVPVREDRQIEMLHDKFSVINGATVETGSFNYTAAAASREHAENAMVLRHVPDVGACYIAHWKHLWDESTPM